jgi:hypothetical protein
MVSGRRRPLRRECGPNAATVRSSVMRKRSPRGDNEVACGRRVVRRLGAWICFADVAEQMLRPAKARTWAPRGKTPIVKVTGKARAACRSPARPVIDPVNAADSSIERNSTEDAKGEKRGFREPDFAVLLDAAPPTTRQPDRVRLGQPARTHRRRHAHPDRRPALATGIRPPGVRSRTQPVESVWSHLKRSLANLAAGTITRLANLAKIRLKEM